MSSELMYLTVRGGGTGFGFEAGSLARHELFEADPNVQCEGTSKRAWCFSPAAVKIRVGDLKVMVYGFSVISAVRPPVVRERVDSSLFKDELEIGLSSGKRGMFGNGS